MIPFSHPMVDGTLLRRYKRFLADVRLADGEVVVAHCPNSGAMLTCADAGDDVLLTDHVDDHRRSLRYTWEASRRGRGYVVVNTMQGNRVVAGAIAEGGVPELRGYGTVRREVPCGRRSRLDFLLSGRRGSCYVEVKSATMRVGRGALFPDAVTERGTRHLEELARVARAGHRAVIFFFVGRTDCDWVGPCAEIDPDYARTLRRVVARHGVEAIAYRARVTRRGIGLGPRVMVRL